MRFVHQPAEENRLGEFLIENLHRPWPVFRAAVAFVKRSGTRHIVDSMASFSQRSRCEIIVGIDHRGTSYEGLEDLLRGVGPSGRVLVFHNPISSTFHPKVYLFRSDTNAEVLIGSGNLTEGGIFTNYEASIHFSLDLSVADDASMLRSIEAVLDNWADTTTGTTRLLDSTFLRTLVGRGYVPVEALTNPERDDAGPRTSNGDEANESAEVLEALFSPRGIARAPSVARSAGAQIATTRAATAAAAPITGPAGATAAGAPIPETAEATAAPATLANKGFVMTLQQTDVGTGQLTPGASRRSPEVFIPLSARDQDPSFWGWPSQFTEDPAKPGKLDRTGVRMRIGSGTATVNMMTWPDKHDFRLRSEALRSAGNIGDILRIERADPASGFDYFAVVIPPGATEYAVYNSLCINAVRNSQRRYGYY